MTYLLRCLFADFQKTKHLSIQKAHIIISFCIAIVFLGYYSFAPWNPYSKIEAYFQVLGIGMPFLIGIFTVMLSEQEQEAGGFYQMLAVPKRVPVFVSKLLLLILFGAFSLVIASLLFGIGYNYLLQQQIVGFSFYMKAAFILLITSICLYTLHLFLALRFNKGISIGVGIAESLVSALFLTGMGEGVWGYVPCAWPARFVTYMLAVTKGEQVLQGDYQIAIVVSIVTTISALILYSIWACHWEGQNTSD